MYLLNSKLVPNSNCPDWQGAFRATLMVSLGFRNKGPGKYIVGDSWNFPLTTLG